MNRKEWQEKYGIHDIDMELIEEARRCGCRIAETENPPLDYEDVKIVLDNSNTKWYSVVKGGNDNE